MCMVSKFHMGASALLSPRIGFNARINHIRLTTTHVHVTNGE